MKAFVLTLAVALFAVSAHAASETESDPNPTPEVENGYYAKNTKVLNIGGPAAQQLWDELQGFDVANQPGENRRPTRQKGGVRCTVGFSAKGGRRSVPSVACEIQVDTTADCAVRNMKVHE